jgi:hypothetical protein
MTGSMPRVEDDWDTQPNPTLVQRDPAGPRGQMGTSRRGGTGPSPIWDDPGAGRSPSGPMPREDRWSGYQGDYQDWPEASQGQGWLEASHDGHRYAEQPPWEGYFPESDSDFRYREPGPGMPGYRGSREHRYGGERY